MTIDFAQNEYDTKTRLRKRRRQLEYQRKKRVAGRVRGPILILSICLITGMAGYLGAHDGNSSNSGLVFSAHAEEQIVYQKVVIKNGDTIWSIASSYSEPSKDIRKLVREICDLNGIDSANIYPGQVIKVPVPQRLVSTLSAQ